MGEPGDGTDGHDAHDHGREAERRAARVRRRQLTGEVGRSRVHTAMIAALVVVSLLTAVGLWVLRPTGDGSAAVGAATKLPETLPATVTRVREAPCQLDDADGCLKATVRLEAGEDRGRRFDVDVASGGGRQLEIARGDRVRVSRNFGEDAPAAAAVEEAGLARYSFVDFDRRRALLVLALIFVAVVVVAGRLQGMRALLGLAASLGVLLAWVVPALLQGREPLLVALVGAVTVALLTIPLAHGVGPKSLAALLGTVISLLFTIGLAVLWTDVARISGFVSEEVQFLLSSVDGLSVQGLLLAGVVIGALGVLDDVTVSQASTVMALRHANPALRFRQLFQAALSVGRDHLTATVNTLVLAYAGASLPILLIYVVREVGPVTAVNYEAVAAQVVSTLVGSLGLILAVPVTTAIAAALAVTTDPEAFAGEDAHTHAH